MDNQTTKSIEPLNKHILYRRWGTAYMQLSTQTLWDTWLNESATKQTRNTWIIVANKTNTQNTNNGTPEMLSLDKRHVIDESVVDSFRSIEALCKKKFREYQNLLFWIIQSSFMILLRGTPLHFPTAKTQAKTKQEKQVTMVKDDVALYSRLNLWRSTETVICLCFSVWKSALPCLIMVNCNFQRNQTFYAF